VKRLEKKEILLVDDNQDITEMVQEMLEGSPYHCVVANTGKEGLELIKHQDFDLIMLDMVMPEMSGLGVLRKLKELDLAQKTSVVLVTASPMYTEMDLSQIRADYGAIERVKKPFTQEELLSVIKKYV
jgi:CheY-like chemotaxis protein